MEVNGIRADIITTYRFLGGYGYVNIKHFFDVKRGSRTRNHNWKFGEKRVRRDMRKHFSSNIVDTWNNYIEKEVYANIISTFKSLKCKDEKRVPTSVKLPLHIDK